jgi:hypothetical protein
VRPRSNGFQRKRDLAGEVSMGEQTLTGLASHPTPAGAMPPVARSRGLGVVDLDSLTTELLAVIEQAMQPSQASLWLQPQPPPSGPACAGMGEPRA